MAKQRRRGVVLFEFVTSNRVKIMGVYSWASAGAVQVARSCLVDIVSYLRS